MSSIGIQDSRNFARFFGVETGTVSGTESLWDLELRASDHEKLL